MESIFLPAPNNPVNIEPYVVNKNWPILLLILIIILMQILLSSRVSCIVCGRLPVLQVDIFQNP